MKKALSLFVLLALLCSLLVTAQAVQKLDMPKVINDPGEIKVFDTVTLEIEPISNAESYHLCVQQRKTNSSLVLWSGDFQETTLVYSDWEERAEPGLYTFEIWATAEGYESQYLFYDIEVGDIERPVPPEMTLTVLDEPLTELSRIQVSINDGYDAFVVSIVDHWSSFPYENRTETVFHAEYIGDISITVTGRKNGVWSLPCEAQTLTVAMAETLAEPKAEILTDPLYVGESIEIQVEPVENATYYSARLYLQADNGFNIVAAAKSEDPHFWIMDWEMSQYLPENVVPGAGDYTLVVYALAQSYHESHTPIPVTLLEERPDEEKVLVTPTPAPTSDPFSF